MSQHLVVFSSNVLSSGVLQSITPVADPTITIGSNNLYVPTKYNLVLFCAGFTGAAAATRQQLRSPSLRELFYPEITPANITGTFSGGEFYSDFTPNPITLQTNEGLNFFTDGGGDGTTAQRIYGVVIFGDAAPSVQKGKIFPVYATTAIQAKVDGWASGVITLSQTLPVGKYDIVGMRINGAGLIAARLIFIGASAVTRPGIFCTDVVSRENFTQFRNGNNGVLGTFDTSTPPSLEIIGGTSSSQNVILDLIKRS